MVRTLSLEDKIGVGELPDAIVKINILLKGEKIKLMVINEALELDEEATKFLFSYIYKGNLDYGPREIDCFPDANKCVGGEMKLN